MPANKNAITRYYILDKLLAKRYCNYSTEDLCRLVNRELEELGQSPVSRRTIELDLNYLEYDGPFLAEIEHYQIDVVSSRTNKTVKKSCHRYVDSSFSIFKKELTDDEKYLLSEAISLLGQFDGLPNLDGLESLRKSLNINNDRKIISFDKNPLGASNLLGEIFTAISQRFAIEVHYHRFDTPEEVRTIILHPYLLKEYNRRWYLIASADVDGKILTFSLDRIVKVIPLPSIEYIPYKENISERFEDIIGVTLYEDRPLQTILFWVSDLSKDYVATKPLHESQRNIRGENEDALRQQFPMLEGGRFFTIDCIENYELIRELTSFGKELLVLSPNNIRETVATRIREMHEAYQVCDYKNDL